MPRLGRRGVLGWAAALLALLGLAGVAAAQAPEAVARDWERLPDGRVVIEIYGRRLAFPADLPPGLVVFAHGQRPHPTRPGGWELRTASLQEVIADRAMAERWWGGSDPGLPVGIDLSSRLVGPFLFEGEGAVDRNAVRLGPVISIWIYRDHGRTECQSLDPVHRSIDIQTCNYFLERSRDLDALDENGFIVEAPSFLRGTGAVYHLFPEREGRAAPGDPAHIACRDFDLFFHCNNGTALRRGYFIQPGIFTRYNYSTGKTDRPDMRRIDDAFRAAATRFLLDDTPPR